MGKSRPVLFAMADLLSLFLRINPDDESIVLILYSKTLASVLKKKLCNNFVANIGTFPV